MVTVRRRLVVTGLVQGVGFRPFVHSLATEMGLAGSVRNDASGVVVEVEGEDSAVDSFGSRLRSELPPLAVVERIVEDDVPVLGESGFNIGTSDAGGALRSPIGADSATCADCLNEISDPGARRFRYAFTNCTNCGPRFTITKSVPYDRANTTMARFEMCEDCRAEYEDPADRRFHAQPIACRLCGPSLKLSSRAGDAIDETARVLGAGGIVAIKGLGGYHLACDATDESAVAELRRRKAREEKPLAVMAADLDAARLLGHVSPEEAALLSSRRRPIVLLRKTEASDLAPSIAPGNRYLGVMLPYTPLHHLLLTALGRPVVLTSGNMSDEPIAYEDGDAAVRLASVADAFLTHDRAIHMRCDDSVVRVSGGREYPIRRSRGYAPEPISISRAFTEPILAAGPELKHTFCIGMGERAIVSHHIGDLESYEAMSAFVEAVEHYEGVFGVSPKIVAHDLHPEYLSTKWARSLDDVELIGVQHHHAHVASCLADNDRWDPVIGLALDGTGLGDDGTLWGCEVLVCDASSYERVGHLRDVPLPGAAQAIKEPWRMAAIYLHEAFGPDATLLELEFVERTGRDWKPLLQMAATRTNSPLVSSAGRLFDAAAALCGVRDRVSYEGQAAAELEQLADRTVTDLYPCQVADGVIDGVMLIAALASDLAQGRPAPAAAAAFHNGFVRALIELCEQTRAGRGLQTVALSGGTFQNLLLLEGVRAGLHERGFEVLTHRRVPTNDGGISLGQAVVANASRSRR